METSKQASDRRVKARRQEKDLQSLWTSKDTTQAPQTREEQIAKIEDYSERLSTEQTLERLTELLGVLKHHIRTDTLLFNTHLHDTLSMLWLLELRYRLHNVEYNSDAYRMETMAGYTLGKCINYHAGHTGIKDRSRLHVDMAVMLTQLSALRADDPKLK